MLAIMIVINKLLQKTHIFNSFKQTQPLY